MPDSPVACDLLIRHAAVLTLVEGSALLADGAVAIAGDRILAVGPDAELAAAYAPAETVDAGGGIVMPGFVNTHNHTPLIGVRGMFEDLGFAPAYTAGIPQMAALSPEHMLVMARLGQYEMLRAGSTTVVDFYRRPDALAQAAHEIGLRAFIGGRIMDADAAALAAGRWETDTELGDRLFDENADAIERWDGTDGGRIRCGFGPHAADTCSPDLLRRVAEAARTRGGPVHTHLCQSRREVEVVRERDGRSPVDRFDEVGLLGDRLIAAHCVFLDDTGIERVGAAGVHAAHAPIGNSSSGMVAPILALARAGANVTLCGDSKTADMFESMRMATALARIRDGGFEPTAPTLLGWATVNGAAALGLGDEVGRLAPGMKADVVVLDAAQPSLATIVDGYGIVVRSASALAVDTVVVDGAIRLRGGRPVGFDGDAIVAEARELARSLWAAA